MALPLGKESEVYSFWDSKIDINELAEQQGVKPVTNVDDLYGDFWPEEENIEDFLSALREWRSEGTRELS